MVEKKKGKKVKKREKKIVDEYQLRRDLREQAKMIKSADLMQETAMPTQVEPQYSEDIRIGGIEGGATHSILIILDRKGAKLTEVKGPHTNHWVIGKDETAARLSAMIERGKQMLNIPENVPLDCVALTLSGCEEETINREIVETLLKKYPQSAKDYVIGSDTLGSLRTGLESGGIVLIAGTGSNALLINPDGKTHNCGGWGHIMGDEGGAYWIAYRACKYVFDDIDGLIEAPESISYVWPAMRSYFNVTDRRGLLLYLYSNFDKSIIAGFAKEVAIGCERGDPLCLKIFEEAGQLLAKHIIAVSKKAHNDLKLAHGGLKVICIGSVWKSWKFIKNGFVNEIHNRNVVDELSLLHLTTSAALGACYLAAEKINCSFVKPYDSNVETFFHYKRDHYPETRKTEHSIELKNHTSDYNSAQVHGNEEST
ncbi:N-acetyl-D-glucosamine kinase [Trachymyrmex zeteki]|uniref:N-acetyl-D-glucosamine kinase n=1 Tax=Mycetomoellerius zeteki TaxID=64791 RepID=A0A151WMI2_9HYME|nr:PREDICTED: N-acetyl-D-glucosamine kinase isoform X2 [Trachymyrmex zeteki]KYQ49056.1 N-acetyl-D-glucosamine kinase [Trachymyrmex zeteki]